MELARRRVSGLRDSDEYDLEVGVHRDLEVTEEEVEDARALPREASSQELPPSPAGAKFDRHH